MCHDLHIVTSPVAMTALNERRLCLQQATFPLAVIYRTGLDLSKLIGNPDLHLTKGDVSIGVGSVDC